MFIDAYTDARLKGPERNPASEDATSDNLNSSFEVYWADCEEEVREAQRFRYMVFMKELGARENENLSGNTELDIDRFDPFCDHLLVRAPGVDGRTRGPLVGTYRLLAPDAARRAGGFYADTEFDMTSICTLRARAVELGRAAVHREWRSGAVIMALWGALGRYMTSHRLDTMIGCASISMNKRGQEPAKLWEGLQENYLAAPQWRVRPLIALPMEMQTFAGKNALKGRFPPSTPPLIKGYLRCGVRLLGPPAFDAAFNTADLPMMLRLADLAPRYRKRFLGN
ncbi:GNAT family N-acetyltransferase [Caballeronia sordidicola]|uniref:L-ornithine N(alpha)-acyltransferase n=1 Tax=Caballeronia sordidicola TaxID=196367 RepID=A0A242N465_CABSO|nr:GNAT family N-acyltransferase [Caballeronia sordidicola]OTP78449.1 putative hemolysin [Caballeronia sordidicola]